MEKEKITAESINRLFGIRESFELPAALLEKLLNKEEKDKLCNKFMEFEFDARNDCLRDYFQENNAARKSLKQDYTPDCLCQLIAGLAPKSNKIIDICSGTGALTIGMNRDIEYQCEELSAASIPVLLFNLALRGMEAVVIQKDVLQRKVEKVYKVCKNGVFSDIIILTNYKEEKSDVVISNPPYSLKWQPKNDERFDGYGLAPSGAGDYAFVLDGLSRLTDTGQAFYILPAGVLFRGGAEREIRKKLVENNLVDAVISLPEKLFLNTSIPVNILVFNKAKQNKNILFIYADKLFEKNGKQNVMTDEHIKEIVDVYQKRETIERFSRVVGIDEIIQQEYNLNIPRYVDTFEPEELPPLSDIVKEFICTDLEAKKATQSFMNMMKNLCGDDEFNQIKEEFVNWFTEQDIVGETLCEWLELQHLEAKTNYIVKHAKKERKSILDIADFERAKAGKIYEAGATYIKLSATDGKVYFLTESKELKTGYGVFIPKHQYVCPRYLYYALEGEIEGFLAKYQCGININPDIFKHLQVTYYPEYKWQKELSITLDNIDYRYNA